MADIAMIENGKVAQVWRDHDLATVRAEVGEGPVLIEADAGTVACAMLWDGEAFSNPPPPPVPVPDSITRRQLLLALKAAEIITPAEAVAAAQTGAAPAAVAAMFDTLAEPHKSDAYITWASMSVAERGNPLVAMLAASQGMDDAAVDDFFRAAAAI